MINVCHMRSYYRRPSRFISVVVLYVLLQGFWVDGAFLPASITSGYTATTSDTVPLGGVVLNVSSMLVNAAPNSSTVFHAEGLEFAGSVVIACPASVAPYTVSLLVTIVNGTTLAGMSAASHIQVSGVLGGGSRVSIRGGSYTFANASSIFFFQVTAALTLTASSTLEIVNASFTVQLAGDLTSILYTASNITLSNHSTLSITNATIEVSNARTVGNWKAIVLYASSSPITLSNSSILSVTSTIIVVHDVIFGGLWYFYVLHVLSSPTVLSDDSQLSVTDATVEIFEGSVMNTWQVFVLFASFSPITLFNGSILSVVGTTVGVRGTNVGSGWWLYVLYASSSPIAVSNSSILFMEGTTVGVYNVSGVINWSQHPFYALSSPITLNASTFSIVTTTIHVYNTTEIQGYWFVDVLRVSSSPMTLSSNSTVAIVGTTIEVHHMRLGTCSMFVVYASSPITVSEGSTLFVTNTIIGVHNVNVTGGNGWGLHVVESPSTTVTINSTVAVANAQVVVRRLNSSVLTSSVAFGGLWTVDGALRLEDVTIDGVPSRWLDATSLNGSGHIYLVRAMAVGVAETMIFVSKNSAILSPTFYVCNNYLNGTLCTVTTSGEYPCASRIPQGVHACQRTVTFSDSTTATSTNGNPSTSMTSPATTRSMPVTAASASASNSTFYSPSNSAPNSHTRTPSPSFHATTTAATSPSPRVTPSLPPPCPIVYTSPCPYTEFTRGPRGTNVTNNTEPGCDHLRLSIPHSLWSGGDRVNISVRLATGLSEFYVPSGDADKTHSQETEGLVWYTQDLIRADDASLWVDVGLRYVGAATRGSWSVVVDILLLDELFSCRLPASRVVIPLTVQLGAAPPIPDAVDVVVNTVAVLTPTGLIRGGMLSSLLGMMRCSEFDPEESLSFINNPAGWAIGESGPRYQRGSAATVLIVLCAMGVCALVGVGLLTMTNRRGGGLGGAVDLLRLPSVALPAVLLLSEAGVSSAVTLVLYDPSEASDVVVGLVVLFLLVGYMVLQAVRVLRGGYTVERVDATNQSVLQYLLDPTHEVNAKDERWLRRNFSFVDGRGWPLFGVLEVAAGTFSNMLEGIPLTVSVGSLCAAKPACILAMSLVLLVLLVWRVPNAVRLSQASSVIVTALLCMCSTAVLVNIVSPSDRAEGAATYIGLVASALNGLLGMAELVGLLLALIPSTVASLGLKSRALDTAAARAAIDNAEDGAVPMLQLPQAAAAPSSSAQHNVTSSTTTSVPMLLARQQVPKSDATSALGAVMANKPFRQKATIPTDRDRDDDEAWVENMIAKVHGRDPTVL